MSKENVITDYSKYKDNDLSVTAEAGLNGTKGNAYFSFKNNEVDNVDSALKEYDGLLPLAVSNDQSAIAKKDAAKLKLVNALKTLTTQINLQANHDLVKLKSTNFPLYKDSTPQTMGAVVGFSVERGVTVGAVKLSVSKPTTFSDHGTIFAFWKPELGPTQADINDWFFRHANGHSLVINGLKPDTVYPFAAAYKGSDTEPLVWSSIINKKPYDGY